MAGLAGRHPQGAPCRLAWPAASQHAARANLRQCIARLRKLSPTLLLDDGDLLALGTLVVLTPRALSDPPLLEAHDYSDCDEFALWLQARADGERASERAAVAAEMRRAMQAGDLDQAQERADALLALDRESEDAYRALMEVSYLRGDFAAAIAMWDRCRLMLRTIYGVLPSTATQSLGAAVLAAARSTRETPTSSARVVQSVLPLNFLHPPRLIGRDEVLRSMTAAWRSQRTLCVTGEAGIGKSRILAEFAAFVGDCAGVAARPGDEVRPFGTLTRLVSTAIDRFRPSLDSEDARVAARALPGIAYWVADALVAPLQTEHELHRALVGVRGLLAQCMGRGCAALLLDDLQFADRATIEALPTLMEAPLREPPRGEAGPRFVFGSRLDDPNAPHAQLIAALAASRDAHVVALEPLDGAEVDALIDSLALPPGPVAASSRRLFARVGGNPAFVIESLKLALTVDPTGASISLEPAEIPASPGIENVIRRRIALLSARARHIAQLAAIAGISSASTWLPTLSPVSFRI